MESRLSEDFLLLYCEKNSDLTKNLQMKGRDLWQKFNTRLKPNDMHKICDFLRKHTEVISLDLCYNDIGDEGLEIFLNKYLIYPNKLQHLNLMYCDITEKGIASFVSLPFITLKSLRLNGNKFGTEGGKSLGLLLMYTDTILHLDIGETDQTLTSVAYYVKVLRNNLNSKCNLRVLDLSRVNPNFNRYPYDSGHFAESIGEMLRFNKTLIEIHLQKNQFDCHDLELMMIGFDENRTLLMFDVAYNRIADYGIEVIAKYFMRRRSQLLGLNVAGNGIGNIGARALSFALPSTRIRILDIGHNKITDDGMLDILKTIKKPFVMRMLNIWGNAFTHESNYVIRRLIAAKVIEQKYLDVKVYEVDGLLYTAYYPSCRYKHLYYSVMDYGCPVDLKIKRNYVPRPSDKPRALLDFKYYPRIPPVSKREPSGFNNEKVEKFYGYVPEPPIEFYGEFDNFDDDDEVDQDDPCKTPPEIPIFYV